jgi:hypothetical protein
MSNSNTAQLRRSAAIRVGVSVLIAGGATTLAILALWGPLSVETDVLGYPIFANFDPYNYFRAFYFAILLFPVAALLLFLGLTRIGPRIGLRVPPPRGSLRPSAAAAAPESALEGDPPLRAAPLLKQRAVAAARVAFVGAVLGLEVGIAANHVWRGLVLGLLAYALGAAIIAAVLERAGVRDWSLEARLSAVNAIGTSLSFIVLFAVSAHTEVRVLADGSVSHYSWFPLWLALPITAAMLGLVAAWLRRAASAADVARIERRVLVLVAAPICLFLLLVVLPGDLPQYDTFENGQLVVGARLVGDGWLPWRDVVLSHGILQDAITSMIGFAVFGDSVWGSVAGTGVITGPLYLVATYFLFVYLFGRNWLFLLFAGLVLLDGSLAASDFRFILWPLILLLLAAVLNRPGPLRAISLAFLLVVQTLLTPEAAPSLLAVTVVVILYEWYERKPGTGIVASFPRTLPYAAAGIAFSAVFAIYMASRGALDDYLYISAQLVHGHVLDGGIPPAPSPGTSQALFDFLALAPPAALLISFTYAATKLRLRQRFLTEDWVMAASAVFLVVYYSKFLSRMDNHVYQPFEIALPLLLYIVYRAVSAAERLIRDRWSRKPAARLTAHPVGLLLVVVFAALNGGLLRDRLADSPDHFRPAVAQAPRLERLGYVASFDGGIIHDLRRVLDAYLQPDDTVFDFSGEPGLFFYLYDRDPSTRYPLAMGTADNAELQGDLVDQLRTSSPKLIVFDNTDPTFHSLSNFDGTSSFVRLYLVSRWILDHYRPLLATHGHIFYARRDLPAPSEAHLKLSDKPATHGIEFLTQPCNWGYSPTFLSGPVEPPADAESVKARTVALSRPLATITGWAGDPKVNAPARKVIAAVGSRIVGRTAPRIDRPDLIATGWQSGFARSGFQVKFPAALRTSPKLRVYAVAADGSVTELPSGAAVPPSGTVRLDGRTVRLEPTAVVGHVDATLGPPSKQIEVPPGSDWNDYRWLEIDAGKDGFRQGSFAVFDLPTRPSYSREISFQTLERSPDRYVIPVGSCPQWHGYRSRKLFLAALPHQDISAVRLIR